ncbi:hypothetical protein AAT19DRAFT_12049 [Rhodotorula toruloides]|uniref:Uncharacterized protein n=1 Tax=Rhodotorula toruloides TaxID=5286 RepID=A0A2T0AF38_RHOTO|nr:hypothetical protein AAT19DRAFT_12049 [Rhodotorula toruloides]
MSRTVNLTARAAARYQPGFSAYNLNATQFHSGQSAPRRAPFTVPTPIRLNLSKPAGPRNHGSFGSVEIALCLHAKTNSYPSKFVQKVPATVGSWDHYLWRGDSLDELFGIKCTWKDFGIVTPGGEEKKLLFLLKPFDSNQHRLLNAVMYGCRLRLIDFTIELKPTPVTSRPVGVMRVRIGSHPFIVERWEKLEGNLFSIEKHDELVNTLRELATVLPSTPTRVQQMLNRPPRFNLLKVLKPDGPAIDWSWIERADDEGFKLPDTFLESLSPLHKAYWKLRQIRPDLVVLVEQGQSVSLYHDQTVHGHLLKTITAWLTSLVPPSLSLRLSASPSPPRIATVSSTRPSPSGARPSFRQSSSSISALPAACSTLTRDHGSTSTTRRLRGTTSRCRTRTRTRRRNVWRNSTRTPFPGGATWRLSPSRRSAR